MEPALSRVDRLLLAAVTAVASVPGAVVVLPQFRDRYRDFGTALPAPTQLALDGMLTVLWLTPAAVAFLHGVRMPPVLRLVAVWMMSTVAAFWLVGWVDRLWAAVLPAALAVVASLPRSTAMGRTVRVLALGFAAANLLLLIRAAEVPFGPLVRGYWVMP